MTRLLMMLALASCDPPDDAGAPSDSALADEVRDEAAALLAELRADRCERGDTDACDQRDASGD